MKRIALLLLIALVAVSGCSTKRQVERIDSTTAMDLSGRWNDTDSRLVAEEMITDSLGRAWLTDHIAAKGKKPTVIVSVIQNKTHEHISTDTFIKDIERAYINSGKVSVVQSSDAREALRDERADQQEFASPETMKKWGREKGADFMLQGVINSVVDQYQKQKTVFYQVDLELTNIETNEKVWLGSKEIKKLITN